MAMRVSGINSGLDTDAIVQELVSAYSKKTEKYEKEQTKLSWKQDVWKSLNSKVYSLYTSLSKLRYSGAYAIKKVNSSDATKATVSASGNAVNGTHKLNVLRTAQSAYLTGRKVTTGSGEKITSETTLKELGLTKNAAANLRVETTDKDGNKVTTDIKLTEESTIEDVTTKLQEAGLNASFDEKQGRFYISSKTSGADGDFTIKVADTKKVPKDDGSGDWERDEFGNVVFEEIPASAGEKAASGLLLDALGLQNQKLSAAESFKTKQGKDVTAQTKLFDLNPNFDTFSFEARIDKADGTSESVLFAFDKSDSIETVVEALKEKGISASFDADNGRLLFHGMDKVTFGSDAGVNSEDSLKALGLLGNGPGNSYSPVEITGREEPIKINGEDAVIFLDGARYTSSTNEFSINGLDITAQSVTDVVADPDDESIQQKDLAHAVTISTSTDSQGLYDTIKNFLTEYNNIINEITKLYNADSARGYEPLTDEEKDAMTDTEIAKWESKIKDSLLRRDSSLSSVMSAMITSMNTAITIDGQTYSLTTFGIHTMGFLNAADNEQNAFHIDGDEEDENTSGNEEKLMAAIKEDPDTVIEFMKQLSTNLYNAIDKQMQGNSLRSRYKIYNDKEMDKQYTNYAKTIKEWEKKVSAKEDYYYKKFSAMETALAKLNSQQSSLAGLLGN